MGSIGLALTIFFGLLSLVLSLVLYFRGRHRKRLTFTYDLAELQTRTHPEVTIRFKDKQIENLSRLRVVIWNSGNQEIRRSDIPSERNPSIVLSGGRVLSVAMGNTSPGTGCAASERDDKTVSIDFEFLNSRDYAILDVLCERVDSKHLDILFVGRVIGGLPSESRQFMQPLKPMNWMAPTVFTLAWCVGAYYWLRELLNWIHNMRRDTGFGFIWSTPLLAVGALMCWTVFHEYFRRYQHSRLPRPARGTFDRASLKD